MKRPVAIACIVAALIGIAGIWYVALQQGRVLEAVTAKPAAVSRLWLDYTDAEGRPQHVEVTSMMGETQRALALRLREAVTESEREFPRR